jgi:hypothetical protein
VSAPEAPVASAAVDLLAAHLPAEQAARAVQLLQDAGLLVDPSWAEDIRQQCAAEHRAAMAEVTAENAELHETVADLTDQVAGLRDVNAAQQRAMSAARTPHRRCWTKCPEAPHAVCALLPGHRGAHETDWSGGQHVTWGGGQ